MLSSQQKMKQKKLRERRDLLKALRLNDFFHSQQ